MVQELAQGMAARGWQVTVAAGFPHHPYGRLYPGYRKKWLSIEDQNGFRVVRGWHLTYDNSSLIARSLVMGSQSMAYLTSVLATPRPDVVISSGPPLIGPLISAMIAGMFESKLVTVIYDFYPDILIELGHLRNPTIIAGARKLESLVYRWSDRILVLSEGFRRTLMEEKGVDPEKLAVVPVWLDSRDVVPGERDNPWRREMGLGPEKFVVLYSGTIGLVSGAQVVIEAARSLADHPHIMFVLVGEGQVKSEVEVMAREAGLKNMRFLPFQPRERLSEVQASADVSLVTLAPGRGKTSVPSKVLGYMAAARPVVAAVDVDCDTAEMIRRARCGLVVPPAQGQALAEAILQVYQHPEEGRAAGASGRDYFLKNLERRVVVDSYLHLLEELS
jgi:colanic acid biosynthesis glycosyl transferase WcaI